MARLAQRSGPCGVRAVSHISGGRMKVTGIRPMLEIRPCSKVWVGGVMAWFDGWGYRVGGLGGMGSGESDACKERAARLSCWGPEGE